MFAINQAIAAKDPTLLSEALTQESLSVSAFVEAVALIDAERWWESHHAIVREILDRKGPPWLYALYEELPASPMAVAEYSHYLLETPCIDPALALHVAERAAGLIEADTGMDWVARTVLAHYLSVLLACGQYERAAEVAQQLRLDETPGIVPGLCLLYLLSSVWPSLQLPENWKSRLQNVGIGRLVSFLAFHAEPGLNVTTLYKDACAVIEYYRHGFSVPVAGASVQVPVELIIRVLENLAASPRGAAIRRHLEVIIRELNLDC